MCVCVCICVCLCMAVCVYTIGSCCACASFVLFWHFYLSWFAAAAAKAWASPQAAPEQPVGITYPELGFATDYGLLGAQELMANPTTMSLQLLLLLCLSVIWVVSLCCTCPLRYFPHLSINCGKDPKKCREKVELPGCKLFMYRLPHKQVKSVGDTAFVFLAR